jgi:nicotinamidase-related amidase
MKLTTLDATKPLVVIDLQYGILALPGVRPVDDIVPRAASLAMAFRHRGLPVVLVTARSAAAPLTWPADSGPADSLIPDY